MVAFVALFALTLVAPPVVLLVALSRRMQRLRARAEPRFALWVAVAAAVAATGFQAAISLDLIVQAFGGIVDLDVRHALALLVAWVSLCLRIGMRHLRIRTRREN